jgi:hypothetical protein
MLGRFVCLHILIAVTCSIFLAEESWAVPSYTRRYNMNCSSCHTMWGALNGAGVTFRLSGYRAMFGDDLPPVEKDVDLTGGLLSIPTTFPLSIITGVGYDYRSEDRKASNGSTNSRSASTLALEDASLFLSSSLGKHLAAFIEFPMYETREWEFTPTGPAEANDSSKVKNSRFRNESPGFEVAKFWWNNLITGAPRDSTNLCLGISHPPLAYSPGKVRLSVNQYLIYERRALDLISPRFVTPRHENNLLTEDEDAYLFRLSEPQVFAEFNGMLVPGKNITDVSERETFWIEYHAGIANGSNGQTDNNSSKDIYGRFVMRCYNQSLGVFAYYSGNTYDDSLLNHADIQNGGIMSGLHARNAMLRVGPDMTISLAPFGVPVWLENQYLFNRESNPTGFGKEFIWKGGFHQLNWQPEKNGIAYARYDWVHGDKYDDTMSGGITNVKPSEWDIVTGYKHLVLQNFKLIGEYRHHEFKGKAGAPEAAELKDNGFTVRAMVGF